MFPLQSGLVADRENLFGGVRRGDVTRDGSRPEGVEDFNIKRVVGCLGDRSVECKVGLAGGLAKLQEPIELEKALLNLRLLRGVSAGGGQRRTFSFKRDANFKHVQGVRYVA